MVQWLTCLTATLFVCEFELQSFYKLPGGARGVMVIVAGNGHGDTSSNPRRD